MPYDKRALYDNIRDKRASFGMDASTPADVSAIIEREGIEVQYCTFESRSIGAILYKDTASGILVNAAKSEPDHRFDMAHELIHFWFHAKRAECAFPLVPRNKEEEWQANEGAAELLLPYRDFVPRYVRAVCEAERDGAEPETVYALLAAYYRVNETVVNYRIRNLESEILQYRSGTAIEQLSITRANVRPLCDRRPDIYRFVSETA